MRGWTAARLTGDEIRRVAVTLRNLDDVPGCKVTYFDTPVGEFVACAEWPDNCGDTALIKEITDGVATKSRNVPAYAPHTTGNLYPYQQEGVEFLLESGGALLCDEMGLGKTRQALVAAWKLQQHNALPVFIVAPRYTRESWRRELLTLGMIDDPDELWVLEGRAATKPQWEAPFWFAHYEILKSWASTLNLAPMRCAAVIFDEAHWIKNGRSQRGKAASFLRSRTSTVFALTGTPFANRPSELWNLLQVVQGPKSWGSPIDFRERYCGAYRGEYGWVDGGVTHGAELKKRLETVYLRRTKVNAGIELPTLVREPVYADFTTAERKKHDEAMLGMRLADLLKFIDSGAGSRQTLALMTRLRKLTSSAKARMTAAFVLGLLEQDESTVVFTWQRAMAERLAKAIAKAQAVTPYLVHGGYTDKDRVERITEFTETSGPAVLIATIDSLKEGVTLTKANHVVLHDLAWRPTDLLQAEARIHRIGQTKMCGSHWMMVADSIDTIFARAFCTKASLLKDALGIDEIDTMAQHLGFAAAGQSASDGWMETEAARLLHEWKRGAR